MGSVRQVSHIFLSSDRRGHFNAIKDKHDPQHLASEEANSPLPKNVIRIDESLIRDHLDQVVTKSVEQTLHALLDAEAERLRRLPKLKLHPTLYNSPLIYGPDSAREAMASIYRDYLEVSRESGRPILLTAPTWRLDASRVKAAGMPASIVTDAVDFITSLQDEAPSDQPPVAIGGLVGPKNDCYRPDLAPSVNEAEDFHRSQIEELANTGIDFLLAQTLPSVTEAAGIAKAMSRTGKSFLISFCTGTDGLVLDGTPLSEAMRRVDDLLPEESRPLGYFVNCTHPRFLLSAYRPGELDRLIGILANGSSLDVTRLDGSSATVADPIEAWANSMLELHHQHQVPILGGCCGTTRAHLKTLA